MLFFSFHFAKEITFIFFLLPRKRTGRKGTRVTFDGYKKLGKKEILKLFVLYQGGMLAQVRVPTDE